MTTPSTAPTQACTHCAREFPPEALMEVRMNHRRVKRYCATCWPAYQAVLARAATERDDLLERLARARAQAANQRAGGG